IAAERTKTGRGQSKAPRRGEGSADGGHSQELSVLIENRHRSLPRSSRYLVCTSVRRIGHIDIPADVLHVEGDESGWYLRRGRAVVHQGERAVEDVDSAGTRSVQLGLSLVDG